METVIAAVSGYLVGSLPTAGWLGRIKGVDLRHEGSGNPGAANALRTGGAALAAAVLLVEIAKGAGAAVLGASLAGDHGVLVAGLAAAAGNLYNVWYRFHGGKGLGITAGVLLVAWPLVFLMAIAVIGITAWATRSSGLATIVACAFLVLAGSTWIWLGVPESWGVGTGLLLPLAIGLGLLIVPKHVAAARRAH